MAALSGDRHACTCSAASACSRCSRSRPSATRRGRSSLSPALRAGARRRRRADASCRSRSAAGSAATTRCSPAATSRPARVAGGPRWTSPQGFVVRRPLGGGGDGYLPFAALTAIHMAHRLGALVLLPALVALRLAPARSPARRRGRWALALLGAGRLAGGERPRQRPARLAARGGGRAHGGRGGAGRRPHRAARAQRAGARGGRSGRCRRRAARWLHRIDSMMSETLAPAAPAQRLAGGQAAPVLRADQAARRPADRLLRR